MEQAKIDRINALAKKAKEDGLTEAEAAERAALRREYIDAVKASLEHHLDHTYLVDGRGSKRKLQKKSDRPSGTEQTGQNDGQREREE